MTRAIAGLPPELRQPPASIISPDDPERYTKRADWEMWRDALIKYRVKRWMQVQQHPDETIPFERKFCQDPAYWLCIWGTIFEPRPSLDDPRPPDSPFILFPFQIDLLDWMEERLTAKGAKRDGVVSKSRDMGASWIAAAWALHGWLFRYPWQIRLISWRADEVDSKLSDSLFWKVDYLYNRLPMWMRPDGFDVEKHRQKMMLINPVNGNALGGEASTSRAMSGGRALAALYDEGSKNEKLEESYSGTANVVSSRIVLSSEHLGYGGFHYRLGIGYDGEPEDRPALKEIDYFLHPNHDEAWLDDQRSRNANTPGAFEREVLRNPKAGDSTFVYPSAQDKAPVPVDVVPGAPIFVGIDPGHADETAVVWMQSQPDGRMKVLNSYQASKKTADFWGTIIRGTPYSRGKAWEKDATDAVEVGRTPTEGAPDIWEYTPAELGLMEWTRTLPKPQFFGDTSGNNTFGATKDTVYSRLRLFGILVNTDRDHEGKIPAWKMQARTYKGRQEAMKELLPRLDFANTWGGRLALMAVQNYRWTAQDKPRMSEPKTPLHDEYSHLCTAMEYVAVNLFLRRQVGNRKVSAPQRGYMTALPIGVGRG